MVPVLRDSMVTYQPLRWSEVPPQSMMYSERSSMPFSFLLEASEALKRIGEELVLARFLGGGGAEKGGRGKSLAPSSKPSQSVSYTVYVLWLKLRDQLASLASQALFPK